MTFGLELNIGHFWFCFLVVHIGDVREEPTHVLSKYSLSDYVDSCFRLTRSNGESFVLTSVVD